MRCIKHSNSVSLTEAPEFFSIFKLLNSSITSFDFIAKSRDSSEIFIIFAIQFTVSRERNFLSLVIRGIRRQYQLTGKALVGYAHAHGREAFAQESAQLLGGNLCRDNFYTVKLGF